MIQPWQSYVLMCVYIVVCVCVVCVCMSGVCLWCVCMCVCGVWVCVVCVCGVCVCVVCMCGVCVYCVVCVYVCGVCVCVSGVCVCLVCVCLVCVWCVCVCHWVSSDATVALYTYSEHIEEVRLKKEQALPSTSNINSMSVGKCWCHCWYLSSLELSSGWLLLLLLRNVTFVYQNHWN
jgi:hypothetical protein